MPLVAALTAVPFPAPSGDALAAARCSNPLVIAVPAVFPLRVVTESLLPWVDNLDPADPMAPPISDIISVTAQKPLAAPRGP